MLISIGILFTTKTTIRKVVERVLAPYEKQIIVG
jgi:hypothetical protein